MSEIERAIEIVKDWNGAIESEWGESEEHDNERELLLKLLRAELDREKNPLTCDGCKREEAKKEYMHVICMQCTRMNQTRDRYEPKGDADEG